MNENRINGLSLFSGIGGIDVALSEWVRPIVYCEIDPYCQGVLLSRMASGDLWQAPIWDDITTLDGSEFEDELDVLYGGFPCQDISVAGAGKGLEGERSGLFFEIMRLAKEIKPTFIFLENVPAITTRGGIEVVRTIAEMGYDCRWCVISASSVGALHRRERFFLLAHSNSKRCNKEQGRQPIGLQKTYPESANSNLENGCNSLCEPSKQADQSAESEQKERGTWRRPSRQYWPFESREHWQEVVSGVCRVSDGIPFHVDRLRGLGNAVVPQQTKEAFQILMGLK